MLLITSAQLHSAPSNLLPPVFGHRGLLLFCSLLTCGASHYCQVFLTASSNMEGAGVCVQHLLALMVGSMESGTWFLSVNHVVYACSMKEDIQQVGQVIYSQKIFSLISYPDVVMNLYSIGGVYVWLYKSSHLLPLIHYMIHILWYLCMTCIKKWCLQLQ